jgi:hypothetical protein
MLEKFDRAEENFQRSLRIHESLGSPDLYKDYTNLARNARNRGDDRAAAEWQAKRDATIAEAESLDHGDNRSTTAGLSRELVITVLGLAQAAYAVRVKGLALRPDIAEALALLADLPPPLGAVGSFLKAVVEGGPVPALPSGLPSEVANGLGKLRTLQEDSGLTSSEDNSVA